MFSLIYSLLAAYALHKQQSIDNLGVIVVVCIIGDLSAMAIVFG